MKSRFAINNEIIDSDDGFVRFHFSAHTKGALLYIASCYVVRTTIKAKLQNAAWLLLFYEPRPKVQGIFIAIPHNLAGDSALGTDLPKQNYSVILSSYRLNIQITEIRASRPAGATSPIRLKTGISAASRKQSIAVCTGSITRFL